MKRLISALSLVIICLSATAQKLPEVQTTGLRAPADVKIDGKSTEWGAQLQAHNHATDVFYTMANDDENLYLTVQATEPGIVNRVLGGITLTIQKGAKKSASDIAVIYPADDGKGAIFVNLVGRKNVVKDTSARANDSVMKKNNAYLKQKAKWIRTSNITGVDTLLSVYNTDGFEAAGLFNVKKVYTIEMAIPLKHLGLSLNGTSKFTYNFKVNGSALFKQVVFSASTTGSPEQIAASEKFLASMNAFGATQSAPTDFSGEYTLVKK